MGRQLTLCCLPRNNPGDKLHYVRQNGPYQLGIGAGPGYKLPYGTLPRLVLVWMCSEATRTQSRILTLGNSFLVVPVKQTGPYRASFGRVGLFRGCRRPLRSR